MLLGVLPLLWLIIELFLKESNPINVGLNLLGLKYIAFPISASFFIVYQNGEYHWQYLLALMIFMWINDAFAYAAGSLFGKHKLFPRISPGKTWEGFSGGLIGTILGSFLIYYYFPHPELHPLKTYIILAIIATVAGTIGDLIESMFKRYLGIKDSGSVLPGHGGFLDRFDSLLLAIPIAALYIVLFLHG